MTVGLLGLCLGVVHAFVIQTNRGEQVRLIDVFVPFAAKLRMFSGAEPYYGDVNSLPVNNLGISVGVIGLEFILAAVGSLLIQRRLGYSRWRGIHSLTYAAFGLLVAHILISGADQGPAWIWVSVTACWVTSVGLWLGAPAWVSLSESRFGRSLPLVRRGPAMSVNVNAAKCERSGFCVQMAPSVFKLRSENRLTYRPSVYVTEIEAVTRAAEACPVRAISLGLAPTTVVTSLPQTVESRASTRPRASAGQSRRRDS